MPATGRSLQVQRLCIRKFWSAASSSATAVAANAGHPKCLVSSAIAPIWTTNPPKPTTLNTPHRRKSTRTSTYANCARKRGHAREPGRTGSVPDSADDGDVLELLRRSGRPQQQPSAAHVAAPDERGGKDEARAVNRGQHLDVFLRRDAAEQHELRIATRYSGQRASGLLERGAIAGIAEIDIRARIADQHLRRDRRLRRNQPLIWRDDEGTAELLRICNFPAKVQATHVREQLADRYPLAAKAGGDGE